MSPIDTGYPIIDIAFYVTILVIMAMIAVMLIYMCRMIVKEEEL